MEKCWYILRGEAHNGPYTAEEMKGFYRLGTLSHSDLVFKDGLHDWVPFHATTVYHETEGEKELKARDFLDLPPLPPLPIEDELPILPEKLIIRVDEQIEELPVELPPKEERAVDLVQKPSNQYLLVPLFVTAVILFAIGIGFYEGGADRLIEERLTKFDVESRKVLSQAFLPSESTNFEVVLDPSGERLLLSTNHDGKANIKLSFKSIDHKVMSDEPIELKSEAHLEDHFATFEKITLVTGKSIASGHYTLKVNANFYSSSLSFKNLLQAIQGKNKKGTVTIEKMIFLSTLSPEDFDKKLAEYMEKSREAKRAPIVLMIEKYRTLSSLVDKNRESIDSIIPKLKNGKDISLYENIYLSQIGPILQDLIVDNNEAGISVKESNPYEAEYLSRLVNYGKEISIYAASVIEEVRLIKKVKPDLRDQLLKRNIEMSQKLKERGDSEVHRLEEFLKAIGK